MLARYLLFASDDIEGPFGGWLDFQGSFEEPAAAAIFLDEQIQEHNKDAEPGDELFTWAHVVDSTTGVITHTGSETIIAGRSALTWSTNKAKGALDVLHDDH